MKGRQEQQIEFWQQTQHKEGLLTHAAQMLPCILPWLPGLCQRAACSQSCDCLVQCWTVQHVSLARCTPSTDHWMPHFRASLWAAKAAMRPGFADIADHAQHGIMKPIIMQLHTRICNGSMSPFPDSKAALAACATAWQGNGAEPLSCMSGHAPCIRGHNMPCHTAA